jgi:hypothetical protein
MRDDDSLVVIKRVSPIGEGRYEVTYVDALGASTWMRVWATDEMAAYTIAADLIKKRIKMHKHMIIAATIVVLGFFVLAGYGCSRPRGLELCVTAGKNYEYVEGTSDQPNVTSCR